jgi:hypothetical protein
MSEQKPTKVSVLGLVRKSAPALSVLDEATLHDDATIYVTQKNQQLRDALVEATARANDTATELEKFRTDTTNEFLTQKHEYEGKLQHLRIENASLREQLNSTGEKLEKYYRATARMEVKTEEFERFFGNSLATIHDAGEHARIAIMSAGNNGTSMINDAAKVASEGLAKQIQNIATDMKAFLDDLQRERALAEYRPPVEAALDDGAAKIAQHFGANNRKPTAEEDVGA